MLWYVRSSLSTLVSQLLLDTCSSVSDILVFQQAGLHQILKWNPVKTIKNRGLPLIIMLYERREHGAICGVTCYSC